MPAKLVTNNFQNYAGTLSSAQEQMNIHSPVSSAHLYTNNI